MDKHWNSLSRDAMESSSLEIFKIWLDNESSDLTLGLSEFCAGGSNTSLPPVVPLKLLFSCDFVVQYYYFFSVV